MFSMCKAGGNGCMLVQMKHYTVFWIRWELSCDIKNKVDNTLSAKSSETVLRWKLKHMKILFWLIDLIN